MAKKEADTPERGKPSPTWLDCTLRDGGYQNNWEFPDAITQHYLRAMQDAGLTGSNSGFVRDQDTGTEALRHLHPTHFWNRSQFPEG